MSAIDTSLPPSQLQQNGFASSRSNPYDDFVTPNMTPGQTSAYQKRKFHTQNLPDGVDRSLQIRDSTEEAVWQYLQKWQLSQVFPWRTVDVLVLTLEYFEALPTFFSVTPEQAVGHMLTQTETTQTVSLVRFSLLARLEWGFMKTAKGQRRYNAMLQQFAVSMIETAHADVYRALLQAHDPQQVWLMRHGEMNSDDLLNYLKWDLFIFGALQKNRDNPLEKIDAKVKSLMTKYRGEADTYILGEEMEIYAKTVPLRKTRYNLGGQEAVDRINGTLRNGGDSNKPSPLNFVDPISYVNENQVFVARSFVVEGEGDIDPFKRTRQFGEWNILQDNIRTGKYDNERRTILIYNQTRDVMSPISLADCINNCHIWDNNGAVKSLSEIGLDPAKEPDAQYDPFVNDPDSGDGVKFIGDLGHDYLDIKVLRRAANSLSNAMFEDRDDKMKSTMANLDKVMVGISLRLSGKGASFEGEKKVDEAYQVLWGNLSNEGQAAFENIATRLYSLTGNSIFLSGNPKKTVGERLYETIVYGANVPVWNTRMEQTSSDVKRAMLEALMQLVDGEELSQRVDVIYNRYTGDNFEMVLEEMADEIRQNIDQTKFKHQGEVAFNTFWNKTMRDFRNADDLTEVQVYTSEPDGFASPAASKKLKTGWSLKRVGKEASVEEEPEYYQDYEGTEETFSQIPATGDFPSNFWKIPFVSSMISDSMNRMGSSNERMRVVNQFDEYDLGALSQPIGREIDMGRRKADLGYMPHGFKQLGFANLSPAGFRLRLGTMAKHVEHIANSGMSVFKKILALMYIGLPFTKKQFLSLDNNNILVPANFIVLRGNAQVESQIIAKCKSGGGCGYTYYAFSNVAVGDNVLTKTQTINYHFYLRAFVHKPRNVFIIPDVFITGYDGGLGVGFHSPDSYKNGAEVTLDSPSIVCAMVDYNTKRDDLPNPFDITGHWTSGIRFRGLEGQNKPAFNTAARYRKMFGFGMLNGASNMPVLHEAHQNTHVYRGHTEEDNGCGKMVVRSGTGHWGPDTYAGVKAAREGELVDIRDMQYGTGRA